jgi:subtilisin family serine protease
MSKKQLLGIIQLFVLSAFISLSVIPARGQSSAPELEYRKGELIVELKPGVAIETINARWETTTIRRIYGTNLYRLRTAKGKKEAKWRKRLSSDTDLLSVALNPVVLNPITSFARSQMDFPNGRPTTGQNAANYTSQQIFTQLNASELQNYATGKDIIVAVIDTGVDAVHPKFTTGLWKDARQSADIINGIDDDNDGLIDDLYGWDFIAGNGDPSDKGITNSQTSVVGHGTFIAGIIKLLAPGATILPIRAFDSDGLSDAFTVSEAIKYAVDHGAKVINLSFGSIEDSPIVHDAITYARQRGAVLVASVGNENDNTDARPRFPAAWNTETIAVAALDADDRKASFSNFGSTVSVSAPGVHLFSTFPGGSGGDYAIWSGTSFAAPFVAAQAALILETRATADVRNVIESTSIAVDDKNQGFSGKLGKGRIRPLEALKSLTISQGTSSAEIALTATGIEPAARGQAEYETTSAEQKFEVEANGITPGITYSIVAHSSSGISTTVATANSFGGLKIEFVTPSRSGHPALPSVLNPVTGIQLVEVRNPQGNIILRGDFTATSGGGTGGGQSVEREIGLSPTAVVPQATGSAKTEIESEYQKLRVDGDNLPAGSYTVIADGVQLGAAFTGGDHFRAEYRSDEGTLPQALQPVSNISHIEVRNQAGQVVLQGNFQAGGGGSGGGDGSGGGGGGSSSTEFTATIESLPSGGLTGTWQVGGRTVYVTNATEIDQSKGAIGIGQLVEVKGTSRVDGSVDANKIKVEDSDSGGGDGSGGGGGDGSGGGGGDEDTRFTATVQSMPQSGYIGDWVIGGKTVHVSSSTEIDDSHGGIAVGTRVEVRGRERTDGSVDATRIKVDD